MEQLTEETKNKVLALLDEAYACRGKDLRRSNSLARKALIISSKMKDFLLVGKCLNQLALVAMIRGEHSRAIKLSNEAIRILKPLNDEAGVADAKYNLAGTYYKTNNFHLGLVHLIDCLSVYKKLKDYHKQARVYKSIGTVYEYFGDEKNAVQSYRMAIDTAKKVNDFNQKTNAYNPLSGIYLKQNKIAKAMAMINRSCRIKQQTGDIRGYAFAVYGRGKIYAKQGRYEEAEADYLSALDIHENAGERLGTGMAYHKLAELYVEMKLFDKARDMVTRAINLSTKYNIIFVKFKCYYLMYQMCKREQDTEGALTNLELYIREKELVINTQSLKIIESYDLITRMRELERIAIEEKEKAEIIEKKNKAEHAVAVKQEFLSTMSHEIRTPLNAVITIASLLGARADKEEQQLIDALKFAGDNLLMIINDILDFTKLESGKAVLELMPYDLSQALRHFYNTYKGLASEKGLELTLLIDPRLQEYYEIDKTKLLQILGNLVSNAIKFTDAGQVSIAAEYVSTDERACDTIRFSVKDTGQGIHPVYHEQIFDSFFQPFSITTRRQGGSGLGLAIVKKLVELHHGNIHLESEPDKGAIFYFDVKFKQAGPVKDSSLGNTGLLKGKTVLLAEDNAINAMVAIKLLSGWGMQITHVKNGTEALASAKIQAFDFILMDIHMPDMDGFMATRHIRKTRNPNRKTPVFALTADITATYHEDYSMYFTGFLRKPIEISVMCETLKSRVTE